jgi:PAS domain S-box-containing protein
MSLDRQKYSILVVEDNPGDLLLITDYLEESIFEPQIESAPTYHDACEKLENNDLVFDVVLLDLSLPEISGEELINGIISKSKNIPVIVLTGYADVQFGIKSLALGVSDYLLKDEIGSQTLYKSIVYNIERKKIATALIESEERYSSLFHLSPQPMWVIDPDDYRYVQANKAAQDKYGYTESDFLTMTVFDIRFKDDKLRTINAIENAKNGSAKSFAGKFKHIKKNKEIIDVEIYNSLITLGEKELLLVIGIDITEKLEFDNKMTRAIIQAQEDERYEIGAELHDNVCQLLTTSQLGLYMLEGKLDEASKKWYDQSLELIIRSLKEIRNLSHRLAPAFFDDTKIADSFSSLITTFNINDAYQLNVHIDEELNSIKIGVDLHLNLFRILQEQLRNIQKYAEASEINIDVKHFDNHIMMSIADNGKGFDTNQTFEGIGFANMKRRMDLFGGFLEINSTQGNGCHVFIKVPLIAPPKLDLLNKDNEFNLNDIIN